MHHPETGGGNAADLRRPIIEGLYVEAMLLADEAHSRFAADRSAGGSITDALLRIGLSCESLKTTTRLMHIIAWLLHQRGILAGEAGAGPDSPPSLLGDPLPADWDLCQQLPAPIQRIVAGSERLFARIATLDSEWRRPAPAPVHDLFARLEQRLAR